MSSSAFVDVREKIRFSSDKVYEEVGTPSAFSGGIKVRSQAHAQVRRASGGR